MALSGVSAFLDDPGLDDLLALKNFVGGALEEVRRLVGGSASGGGDAIAACQKALLLQKYLLPSHLRDLLFLDLEPPPPAAISGVSRAPHGNLRPIDLDGGGHPTPEPLSEVIDMHQLWGGSGPRPSEQEQLLAERLGQLEQVSGPARLSAHSLLYFLATRATQPARDQVCKATRCESAQV